MTEALRKSQALRSSPKLRVLLVVFAVGFPLDQLSKAWVDSRIVPGETRAIVDGFLYVTHARNPGAAFGLLHDWSEAWRLRAFAAVTLLAFALVASLFVRLAPRDRFAGGALALVLAGACGNLTDRLVRGEVIDWLHLRWWSGYPWPEFNFADAFIVLGVGALIVELMAMEGAAPPRPES